MTCPTCGGALQSAGAKCAVCDPWAVPASDGAPGAAALPPPALLAAAPLPKWLTRIIKKNGPAPADLDLAFRRSVILWSVSGAYLVVVVFALLMFASRAAAPVALVALLVMSLTQIVVSLRFRHRTWMSRAVAVVGTRPDIGYHWFAGIPQLVRRNQVFRSSRFTLILLLLGRIVVQSQWPNSTGPQLILLAAYLVVALCVFAAGIALEVGAVAVLRTRLNQPTTAPAPTQAATLDRSRVL
jgi:xanthosine utilization system XapX-like protein